MRTAFIISAVAAALAFAPAAGASHKSGHDKGPKKVEKTERHKDRDDDHRRGHKHDDRAYGGDRVVVIERDVPRGIGPTGCPPGLQKKNNGCLPPGQAKKLYGEDALRHAHGYRIGDVFDRRVPYFVLRRNEYDRYRVPDFQGQYYVRTEDRLFRLDRKTNAVIDIITGIDTLLN